MTRSSIGLALLLLVPALHAGAQPRQPRPRVDDGSTPPAVTETSPASTTPTQTAEPANPYATTSAASTPDAIAPLPLSRRQRRTHTHDVGVGYRSIFALAEDGTRYFMHGPTVAYTYSVGTTWGFLLHAEASFPMFGHMGGTAGTYDDVLSNTYDQRRYSFDGSFFVARRIAISDTFSLTAAFGLHFQTFELKSVQYLPVEAITGGVGGLAKLDWALSSAFSFHATVASAADFFDFVRHTNRAALVVPFSATVGIGVRY